MNREVPHVALSFAFGIAFGIGGGLLSNYLFPTFPVTGHEMVFSTLAYIFGSLYMRHRWMSSFKE